MHGEMSTRASSMPQSQSSSDVDASSVFRLLLEEQRDALSSARAMLRRMLKSSGVRDVEGLARLERSLSLVKASASYLGLSVLRDVVLEAERVVGRLQLPGVKSSSDALSALEQTLDFVAVSLAQRARHDGRAAAAEQAEQLEQLEQRARELRALLGACELAAPSVLPDQLTDQQLFAEDARRHLESCREAIVRAADEPTQSTEAIRAAFRAVHTLKGNAAMMGFAEIEALGRAAEQALEGLRSGELTLTANVTVALLNLLERAGAAIERPRAFNWKREAEALEVACAEARVFARRTRIGALLVEHNFVTREQVDLVLAIRREPLGQALVLLHALSEAQLGEALEIQRKLRAGEDVPSGPPAAPLATSLQVDPQKLARLAQRMARLGRLLRGSSPELAQALRSVQEVIGALDYVPLRTAFRRTFALLRDLAERQNKQLVLVMHGDDIEVERKLLASVSDALVHLGRNAVDHGIEPELERFVAGKPEAARVTLSARVEPGALVIEMVDDGRGLSRERILQKALDQGLLTASRAHDLSDEQVHWLVFTPGFSTAERRGEVSGCGVGLDAVKHAVEAIGGRVELSSLRGQGTCVTLRLPAEQARAPFASVIADLDEIP
jgi:two-component system, chemotaxis family, sensor kinase CheA